MQSVGNATHVRSALSVQTEAGQTTTTTRSAHSDNQQIAPRMFNKNMIFLEFPYASKSTRVGGPQLRRPKMDERAREKIVNQIRKKNGLALPDQENTHAKQIALVEALDSAYSYESLSESAKNMWAWMTTTAQSLSSYMPDIKIGPPAVKASSFNTVIDITKPSTISDFLKPFQSDFDIQISRSLKFDDSIKGVTIIIGTKSDNLNMQEKISQVLANMKKANGDLLLVSDFAPGCKLALVMYKLSDTKCKEIHGDLRVKPRTLSEVIKYQEVINRYTNEANKASNEIRKLIDFMKNMMSKIDEVEDYDDKELEKSLKKEFRRSTMEGKVDLASMDIESMNLDQIMEKISQTDAEIKSLNSPNDGSVASVSGESSGKKIVDEINFHRSEKSTNFAVIDVNEVFSLAHSLYDGIAGNTIVMVPNSVYENSQYQNLSSLRGAKKTDL